jgi:hypothetical protein
MGWYLVAIPAVTWIGILAILIPDKSFYSDFWDKLTKGKHNPDRNSIQIILNHLIDKPEEWSISKSAASFPLEGSKQIYLNRSENGGWTFQINSTGERTQLLTGHYGIQIGKVLAKENERRVSQSLLRNLYNIEGPLLLK